ncbi:MAG: Ig-like domain-containing protein [Clostridia bacterium]|nr:Ig-like domain-containing protein [Clostridia bacterium]
MSCKKRPLLSVGIKSIIFLLAAVITLAVLPTDDAQAASQTVKVGTPVLERPEVFLPRSMPVEGEGRIAVLLIDFPDAPNDNPFATKEFYEDLYFNGANTNWGEDYSVSQFFFEQSHGRLSISGEVFDWYTARHEQSYYDDRKFELIVEAAEYHISKGADFSDFDGDGDGVIDGLIFHFSGEYSDNDVSHPWYNGRNLSTATSFGQIGGVSLKSYIQIKEDATGTRSNLLDISCHELLHSLGMPDLYGRTTPFLTPITDIMGETVVKELNPYTKLLLGWIDEAKVITEPTRGIRIDGNDDKGDLAIVTDEFDGFLGEFWVVYYRQYEGYITPVVLKVDSRIGPDGQFICDNLAYDVRPDKEDIHRQGEVSPYLFMEELSSDPTFDFVLRRPFSLETTAFKPDSVLGPDSLPSSDTNEGRFTGIRMTNFVEYDDKYMLFDVDFVSDTASPYPVTDEDELKLDKTITVDFNEFIYLGEGTPSISVTDLEGNPLDAKVILPHYPRNQVEITFNTDAYEKGYKIVFPEGSVRDSSGNPIAPTVLTASKDGHFFPTSETMLPSVDPLLRNNTLFDAPFFADGEGFTIITPLWEEKSHALFEFMRCDLEGNVLIHKLIRNPFPAHGSSATIQAPDGSFIIIYCAEGAQWNSSLICIDKNGELRWARDYGEYTNFYTYSYFPYKDGLFIRYETRYPTYAPHHALLDPATGDITDIPFGEVTISDGLNCLFPNGDQFNTFRSADENGSPTTVLQITPANGYAWRSATYEGRWEVFTAHAYPDGSIIIGYTEDGYNYAALLDGFLNRIKTVRLSRQNDGGSNIFFIGEEGFYQLYREQGESHDNSIFSILRYDRYLNRMWESDSLSNFVYLFKSPSGDLRAYRSALKPLRECYIDFYGSESGFETVHVHQFVYHRYFEGNCVSNGHEEYWQCTDCGGIYINGGETPVGCLSDIILFPNGKHEFDPWHTDPNNDQWDCHTCRQCGFSEQRNRPQPSFGLSAAEKAVTEGLLKGLTVLLGA